MKPSGSLQTVAALRSTTAKPWAIGLVCFCVMAIDGFDTAAIAFVAPTLARVWNVTPASLTPAFVMTSIGAAIGYVLSGMLVSRFGRYRIIAASVIAFGALSVATAFVGGVAAMSGMRWLTAICLGWAVPATISCAADYASDTGRAAATIAVTTGLSVGTAVGGFLASHLLAHFGWPSVFVTGGALPLALLPFALVALRGTDAIGCHSRTGESGARVSLSALLQPPLTVTTLLIWAIAFFIFLVTYQFLFWIPTLLVSYGFPPAGAALGSAAFALGGIFGNLALLPFVDRYGVHRVLIATACLAIACIVCLSFGIVDRAAVLFLIGGVGAGITSGCVGQATLAVLAYPERLRTTGVGCAAAAGRVGAIVGPAVGGGLLSIGLPAQQIVTLSCVPIILVVALLVVSRRASMRDKATLARQS